MDSRQEIRRTQIVDPVAARVAPVLVMAEEMRLLARLREAHQRRVTGELMRWA